MKFGQIPNSWKQTYELDLRHFEQFSFDPEVILNKQNATKKMKQQTKWKLTFVSFCCSRKSAHPSPQFHPKFQNALKRYPIPDFETVECQPRNCMHCKTEGLDQGGGVRGSGGGSGGPDHLFPNKIFYYLFDTVFLHRQDHLLLLNWWACFLMESYCILPLM